MPFWSPDSTSVAFFAAGEVRKLALDGGVVQRVCATPREPATGGTWGEAGTIVFSSGGASATLYHVPAAGGDAAPLTTLDQSRGETGHWWPQFLPGGRQILFSVGSSQRGARAGLFALSLDTPSERRAVLPDGARFVYAAGNLLAVHGGILTARAFDPKRLAITGAPVSLATGVATWSNDATWGAFSASANGGLAWLSAITSDLQLQWISRNGQPLATLGERGKYGQIVGIPTTLIPADRLKAMIEGPDYDDYAVTADGQRFLLRVAASRNERQRIHVLLNWASGVQ